MATPKDRCYNVLLNTLINGNNVKGTPLSNEKIQQTVCKVIKEMEAEFERNINKITYATSFQYPMQKNMYQQSTIIYIMSRTSR